MKTVVLEADSAHAAQYAADIIRKGGLVGLPTETVYGLGANALDEQAVAKIFTAKGRPQDNPLILHIAEPEEMERYCHSIPQTAWELAERFWPGPLTLVLPCRDLVPRRTTAGLSTVAVRCPETPVTREIIRLAGVPIAAPSANLSGKPSTTTAQHVLHDLDGVIEAIVDDGPSRVGVESTIVDLTGPRPRLLRPGGIGPEELQAVVGELEIDPAVVGQLEPDMVPRAPGMKYKHYAPQASVIIVTGTADQAAAYIRRHFQSGDAVLCFREELSVFAAYNPTAYGSETDELSLTHGLFAALRELDRPEIGTIYARCPEGGGAAYAVRNRLNKAAGFCIVSGELV